MDFIIPVVIDRDLSDFYYLHDESPGPEEVYETKEIVYKSLCQLSTFKKRILFLLMMGFEPKEIAEYLKTNEMAVTRAKRSFQANLEANGLEV